MHELAIVEGILRTVIPAAEKNGAERIEKICLKIGELSGVVPSCVTEYFTIAAKGTMAEGAAVEMESIPVRVHCNACGSEEILPAGTYACPVCKSRKFRIISGREYFVDHIEVS